MQAQTKCNRHSDGQLQQLSCTLVWDEKASAAPALLVDVLTHQPSVTLRPGKVHSCSHDCHSLST